MRRAMLNKKVHKFHNYKTVDRSQKKGQFFTLFTFKLNF